MIPPSPDGVPFGRATSARGFSLAPATCRGRLWHNRAPTHDGGSIDASVTHRSGDRPAGFRLDLHPADPFRRRAAGSSTPAVPAGLRGPDAGSGAAAALRLRGRDAGDRPGPALGAGLHAGRPDARDRAAGTTAGRRAGRSAVGSDRRRAGGQGRARARDGRSRPGSGVRSRRSRRTTRRAPDRPPGARITRHDARAVARRVRTAPDLATGRWARPQPGDDDRLDGRRGDRRRPGDRRERRVRLQGARAADLRARSTRDHPAPAGDGSHQVDLPVPTAATCG